ncbi:inositol monophosphatase [bacterium]|nr:inositol monophosphatase [bacterium]
MNPPVPACPPEARSAALETAVLAAREAGGILRTIRTRGDCAVLRTDAHDVKLEADVRAEQAITSLIRQRHPDDGIVAEESGGENTARPGVWIVDPLDGTVNFAHGNPHFSTSIAWAWEGIVQVGVIYDPLRDELYTAVRGSGASCNGAAIRVAETARVSEAMIAVGIAAFSTDTMTPGAFARLAAAARKVRVTGSAALDLAFVASGRMDGYYEPRVYIWDLAAGTLLIEEAGGTACMWRGRAPFQRACLAATPGVFAELPAYFGVEVNDCARTCLDDNAD